MTAVYNNSKGLDVEIATMAYPHLKSAYYKLVRDQVDGLRQVEIDAMGAEIALRDAAHAEAEAAKVDKAS